MNAEEITGFHKETPVIYSRITNACSCSTCRALFSKSVNYVKPSNQRHNTDNDSRQTQKPKTKEVVVATPSLLGNSPGLWYRESYLKFILRGEGRDKL